MSFESNLALIKVVVIQYLSKSGHFCNYCCSLTPRQGHVNHPFLKMKADPRLVCGGWESHEQWVQL